MEEKKTYAVPELDIVKFDSDDVITTSNVVNNDPVISFPDEWV